MVEPVVVVESVVVGPVVVVEAVVVEPVVVEPVVGVASADEPVSEGDEAVVVVEAVPGALVDASGDAAVAEVVELDFGAYGPRIPPPVPTRLAECPPPPPAPNGRLKPDTVPALTAF